MAAAGIPDLGELPWRLHHGLGDGGLVLAEAVYQRLKGVPAPDLGKICGISILAVLSSSFNPNGFRVLTVMLHYQSSPLQTHILEWNYPAWWPPAPHNLLIIVTALVLLWARRRVRPADWLLFVLLGGASAMALRNVIFIGCIGPILLAAYFPSWKRAVPGLGIRRRGLAGPGAWWKDRQRKSLSVAHSRLEIPGRGG